MLMWHLQHSSSCNFKVHKTQWTIKNTTNLQLHMVHSCHLTEDFKIVDLQKYQWDYQHAIRCQVSSLIKLIKQKDKQCLAEQILGSGNANRCAILSFSMQQQLTHQVWIISRMLFAITVCHIICSFAELWKSCQSCVHIRGNLLVIAAGWWVPPCCWWSLRYKECTATFG